MTEHHNPKRLIVLCLSDDDTLRAQFAIDTANLNQHNVAIETATALDAAIERLEVDDRVACIFVDNSSRTIETNAHASLQSALITPIDSTEPFELQVRTALTEYLLKHDLSALTRYANMVDPSRLAEALIASEKARDRLDTLTRTLQRSFLSVMEMSDSDVEQAMVDGIDKALDSPARQHVPAGEVFLREGHSVDGVWIVLSGRVQVFRETPHGELILHSHSAGKVVGLIALAQKRKAFHSVRALTDLTLIPLPFEQLDRALKTNPILSIHFVTVLVRSLARRNRRVVELQIEVNQLHNKAARERDTLAETVKQLKQAQAMLIESEKLAVLGQLSAGFAHELNNPISAIQRAADFIAQDVSALARQHPESDVLETALSSVLGSHPVSTRQTRAYEKNLTDTLGDANLAHRLVRAGITTIEEYERRFNDIDNSEIESRLQSIERAHQLATSLRNLRSGAERVTAMVKSLKSHARSDENVTESIDIHAGIDDTLLLFEHALRGIEVERDYGDLERVECNPAQISQVWTNIIANAVDAMGSQGTLRIQTDTCDPKHVRVRIIDSGPGISPEHRAHIFDMRFTTRSGLANFGLGMGLAICKDIIERHGGGIALASEPGRTCFTVTLPIHAVPNCAAPTYAVERDATKGPVRHE